MSERASEASGGGGYGRLELNERLINSPAQHSFSGSRRSWSETERATRLPASLSGAPSGWEINSRKKKSNRKVTEKYRNCKEIRLGLTFEEQKRILCIKPLPQPYSWCQRSVFQHDTHRFQRVESLAPAVTLLARRTTTPV